MSQKQMKQIEHDLLGSLLEDINHQEERKSNLVPHRMQAFSAPPVFAEVNYKLDFDLLDTSTFESPDPQDQNIMEAFLKKQKNINRSFEPQAHSPQGYRKMSCDSGLLEYRENATSEEFNYYDYISSYSPTEQLFSNLSRVQEWARDQNGSRTVQDAFETENQERKNQIFEAIFQDSLSLMTDRFGNYVFQKIFEKGQQKQKQMLMKNMQGSITSLSIHPYGCRVIQKAVQYIHGKQQIEERFIKEITPNALMLIENQNGNHVIQKCFQVFPHSKITEITEIIKTNLNLFAYHTFGCRVIQKYLQNYFEEKECQQILSRLLEQSIPLSQCQFGNYVMQHIVTKCKNERHKVFTAFLSRLFELSTNKYASNVIEKAIQAPDSNFCQSLAQWFGKNEKQFILLCKHQFGNYVVQSMLNRLSKDKRAGLRVILKENTAEISKSQHGRHVLLQIDNPKNK